MKFKNGAAVRQIVKPITGVVTNKTIIDDDIVYFVAWTDDVGDKHERPFTEAELEAVPAELEAVPAEPEAAPAVTA